MRLDRYNAYLTYIEKREQCRNVYSYLGGTCHDVLEGIIEGKNTEADIKPTLQNALDELDMLGIDFPKTRDGGNGIRDRWVGNMMCMARDYISPKGKFEVEKLLILKLRADRYLQGYADLIRVLPDGRLQVLDIKTSSQFQDKDLLHYGRQLVAYTLALEQAGFTVAGAAWIMVKYCKVVYEIGTGKRAKLTEKILDRCKVGYTLRSTVRSKMKAAGYDSEQIENVTQAFIESNDINDLPEDTVSVIDKTCKLADIPYPHTWEMNFDDQKVWTDMKTSPVGIFQFVEDFAFDSLKKYDVHSIADLSLVTAAIRPGGASYRDKLFRHEANHNPSPEIDELLKDSLGWLVFQEQTIAFLQQFCDMSGGDADSVRRAIGHKNKAELDAAMPRILNGYCNHSTKSRETAETEAKEFLQVIENSASYQFGLNHATGYSILTYYCAYYRYYYTHEFITALLNTADTQDKIIKATQLAGERGIQIMPIKFRHSRDEYVYDRSDKRIYQGMESIKYLNKRLSREFYKLRNTKFDSFVDLLVMNQKKKIADSRQMDILIKLDFFSEFGNPNQLLEQVKIFSEFYGAKQLNKLDMDELLPHDTMLKLCEKETEKKYVNVDWLRIVQLLCIKTSDIKTSITDRIQYEADCLGYIQLTIPKLNPSYIYVLDIDGKFSNKTVLGYVLQNGQQRRLKVKARTLETDPIEKGDILRIDEEREEGRWSKDERGQWVQSKTDKETILRKYAHVR